jgi:zinc protease
MRRFGRLGWALGVTVALAGWAREVNAQSLQRFQLANGLSVVLAPDARTVGVNVVVRYEVGRAHDPAGFSGLAHLLEHTTFRGSTHLRPLEGVSILGELGAGYNAVTELECTAFLTQLPSAGLETVLWLESERMGFALGGIDVTGLAAEQRIVVNELRQRGGALSRQLSKFWLDALYGPTHPFARGDSEVEDVQAVELPGLQWFYQTTYRPDNATLVLSGDFGVTHARDLVERYFGPLRNPKLPRASLTAPAPKLCGVHRVDVEHPFLFGKALWVTWAGPAAATAVERQRRDALAHLLQSRLEHVLLARGTDASSVQADNAYFRTHSLLTIRLGLHESGSQDKVERAVQAEARRLATQPPSEQELRALRARLASDSVFSGSGGLARALSLSDGIDTAQVSPATLSSAELREAARILAGPVLFLGAEPGSKGTRSTAVTRSEAPCH